MLRNNVNKSKAISRRKESYVTGNENQVRPNTHCTTGYEIFKTVDESGKWKCNPIKPKRKFRPDMKFDKHGFGKSPKQFKLNGKVSRAQNTNYWDGDTGYVKIR